VFDSTWPENASGLPSTSAGSTYMFAFIHFAPLPSGLVQYGSAGLYVFVFGLSLSWSPVNTAARSPVPHGLPHRYPPLPTGRSNTFM